MKVLSKFGMSLAINAATWAIGKGIEAIDNYIHRLDNAKDAFNNTESELFSVKSEIDNINGQIDKLESRDPASLSIIDKNDLQTLKDQNEELKIRQIYLEKQKQDDAENVATLTKEKYNVRYRDAVDREDIDNYRKLYEKPEKTPSPSNYLTGNHETHTTSYAPGQRTDTLSKESDTLANLIAQYEYYEEEKTKAIQSGDDKAASEYETKLSETAGKLQRHRIELQGFSDDLVAAGDSSSELDGINSKLELIDNTLLGKELNLVNFINEDILQQNKEKLLELAYAGELTADEFSKRFPQLDTYLTENGLSLEDLISIIKVYKDELNSVPDLNEVHLLSPSETIAQLNSQLKPALESIKSAYQDIFTEEGFAPENLNIDMISSLRSTLDDLNNMEGVNIDYSSLEELTGLLNGSEYNEDGIKEIFDGISTAISNAAISGFEDFNALKAFLEDFDIEDSEMIGFSSLSKNIDALKEAGLDLANASDEIIRAFAEEMVAAENVDQAIAMLTFSKQVSSGQSMDTSAEVANLKTLAENAGYTSEIITYLTELEQIYQDVSRGTIDANEIQGKMDRAKELRGLIEDYGNKVVFNPKTAFDEDKVKKPAAKAGTKAADAYLEAFEKELSELDSLKDRSKITEKQYLDALRHLYVKYFNQKKKYLDQYEKYEDQYLSGMKSLYESAFSYITKQIDKRIDAIQKERDAQVESLEAQKKAAEEFYQNQIDAIEDEIKGVDKEIEAKQALIDAINDAADARQREIDLQKAQYDLERMQNQKTISVYKDGQMVHEADTSGIREAREEVEDKKRDIEIATIQEVIDGLEKQKNILEERREALEEALEASNKYWDAQIEQTEKHFDNLIKGMEEYKSRWEELSEIAEEAKMKVLLEELGIAESDILSMSEEAFQNAKMTYLGILSDIYSDNEKMQGQLSAITGTNIETLSHLEATKGAFENLGKVSLGSLATDMDKIASSASKLSSDSTQVSSDISSVANDVSTQMNNLNGALAIGNQALDNQISKIEDEYIPAWENLPKRLAEIIGIGGGKDKESANNTPSSSEDEGSIDGSIVDVMQKGGEAVAEKLDNPWLSSFNDFAEGDGDKNSIRKIADLIISIVNEMAESIKEKCEDAAKRIRELANEAINSANLLGIDPKTNDNSKKNGAHSIKPEGAELFAHGTTGYSNLKSMPKSGYKGLSHNTKNALRSEYGQPELTVYPDGTAEITTEPVMSDLPKGTVIFNEEQTERIMNNKGTLLGKIHENDTGYPSYLTPIDLSDDRFSMFQRLWKYMDGNTNSLALVNAAINPFTGIADSITDIDRMINSNTNGRAIAINIGDIQLQGVQDVNGLSDAIITRLPNMLVQELHRL